MNLGKHQLKKMLVYFLCNFMKFTTVGRRQLIRDSNPCHFPE